MEKRLDSAIFRVKSRAMGRDSQHSAPYTLNELLLSLVEYSPHLHHHVLRSERASECLLYLCTSEHFPSSVRRLDVILFVFLINPQLEAVWPISRCLNAFFYPFLFYSTFFPDEVSNLLQKEAVNVSKIDELEDQLAVYKTAYNSVESELSDAKNKIKVLLFSNHLYNHLGIIQLWSGFRIVTLLDGNGAIFSFDLIKRGKPGGQGAAQSLSENVQKYVTTKYGTNSYQLFVQLFLNKQGLMDALGRAGYSVAKSNLEDFLMGFNQASERFLVVDVGSAKEAADAKIKSKVYSFILILSFSQTLLSAHLEDAVQLPQAYKIIFGGEACLLFLNLICSN